MSQEKSDRNSKMPVFFVGHGSPMNAIADNEYTESLNRLGTVIRRPRAILCISAHWMTTGTFVTHEHQPKTMHDFFGFPKELYSIQYPAPGSLEFSEQTAREINDPKIMLDTNGWGLDHGTWSVLKHLYPSADIPTYQLSLDMSKPPQFHFELGAKLSFLREQGVLMIGSGNIVHNLRAIDWNENAAAHKLAILFDHWVRDNIGLRNFSPLVTDFRNHESGRFSVPTLDHYLPLLYILGASTHSDQQKTIFSGFQNASISMRSILFG